MIKILIIGGFIGSAVLLIGTWCLLKAAGKADEYSERLRVKRMFEKEGEMKGKYNVD